MNRDTWVGLVGAAVLLVAMVGVFVYERNVAIANGIGREADGLDAPIDLAPVNGTVALGRSDEKLVNVTQTGFANATFTLTWKATQGRDTLKLTVAPPTGSGILEGAVSEPSAEGTITVSVAVPDGADPRGAWQVKVEFLRAEPGTPVTPPTALPIGTDSSVSYSVATRLA